MNFNNFTCCCYAIFKNLALTNGFGHIFLLLHFVHDRQASLPSLNFIMFQFMHTFPMFFQCFHVNTRAWHFSTFANFTTRHSQHDALQDAHVQNICLCVTFGASCFGTTNLCFCKCSKYVTFYLIICAHVLQATVCVTSRARRCSAPSRLLGGILAALAAKSRPKLLAAPDLSGFEPAQPPWSTSRARYDIHNRVMLPIVGASMKCNVCTA